MIVEAVGSASLAHVGSELSTFLRTCYVYHEGDESSPHYDRSFTVHEMDAKSSWPGRMTSFTVYPVVIYLNDTFRGGETTFFEGTMIVVH